MALTNANPVTSVSSSHPVYHPEIHHDIFPTGSSFVNWLTMGTVGFMLLFLAVISTYIVRPELRAGDFADATIVAQKDSSIPDRPATELARERAMKGTFPVLTIDRTRDNLSRERLDKNLADLKYIRQTGAVSTEPQVRDQFLAHFSLLFADDQKFVEETNELAGQTQFEMLVPTLKAKRSAIQKLKALRPELNDSAIYLAAAIAPEEDDAFASSAKAALNKLLATHKRFPQDESTEWEPVIAEYLPETWTFGKRQKTAQLLAASLESNVLINEEATQNLAAEKAAHVEPRFRLIKKGTVVVRHNQRLDTNDVAVLKDLGLAQTNRLPMIFGLGISLLAAIALSAGVLYTFDARHLFQTQSIGLMYVVAITVTAAASLIGDRYPPFVPLPAAALVWTIFFGRKVSLSLIVPLIAIIAVAQLIEPRHLISLSIAAAAAIFGYTKNRNSLVLTGFVMGMTQALGFVLSSFVFAGSESWTHLGRMTSFELFAGVVSAMLAIGSLPFLESIFGLVTPSRLAELTDAEQPLLRQLEEHAPGTYQHSLAVANLAEGGARALACDVNLVRAGALYHDIGKMARPKYFIENQLGAKNPHDSMTPEESRERVLAHVTDGIDFADKHRLPKAVQDFIPMHQGTSLMAYFYHKACLRDGAENVDPKFYRYPGPKPQSKETAIVMLADVSEAVTHSMHDPTQEEVEQAIDKVFQNRWEDGQFNESSLTYQELIKVKMAFVRVWRTLHHERLKYPSTTTGRMAIAPEMKGKEENQERSAAAVIDLNEEPEPPCCS